MLSASDAHDCFSAVVPMKATNATLPRGIITIVKSHIQARKIRCVSSAETEFN